MERARGELMDINATLDVIERLDDEAWLEPNRVSRLFREIRLAAGRAERMTKSTPSTALKMARARSHRARRAEGRAT